MFKLLMRVFLLLPTVIHAQSISTREAKAMTNILANSKPDSVQMEILLKLAKYHVFKPGENKDDLDSAVSFIKKAENINARLISNRDNGYISLIKSYWLKESGQRDKAWDAAGHAVALLKNEADKNLAGEAYM